ncbi:hypothetical protein BWR15_20270 [Pseudomonas sp. T]|nr:hypothetical protein BWR15_20270 [Pseudomonas sp. T]
MAIKDPQSAAAAAEIMHRLLGQDAMQQDFAQILLEGGLAVALGAALVATTPQGQEAWAKVAPELSSSVREDVQKLALYLILLQPGSPVSPTDLRLPIFQPDILPVVTPSVDPTLWKPGSGGYGTDGKVELPSSTGGSDIHQNTGTSTTSPANSANLPISMHMESDRISVISQDDDIYELSFKGEKGEMTVITGMSKDKDSLTLTGMHIDGMGAGSSSISELRNFARELGAANGVSEVIIKGGTRTTGANPGKVPRDIRIKVK